MGWDERDGLDARKLWSGMAGSEGGMDGWMVGCLKTCVDVVTFSPR